MIPTKDFKSKSGTKGLHCSVKTTPGDLSAAGCQGVLGRVAVDRKFAGGLRELRQEIHTVPKSQATKIRHTPARVKVGCVHTESISKSLSR